MKTIKSFQVNHNYIKEGLYVSRMDGDITTYDIRTRRPNMGDYMDNITMHSVEHMIATYVRNGKYGENVIYFGPMGCRTGFYLLTRGLTNEQALELLTDALERTVAHKGEVFGATREQCGNYRELSLDAAKCECERFLAVLRSEPVTFSYPEES